MRFQQFFFPSFSACSFKNMKGFPCSPAPLIVFIETTILIGVFFLSFLFSDEEDHIFFFFSCYESAYWNLLKCYRALTGLSLAAVTSSAGLVQIPCNYTNLVQAVPTAAAAIISSIFTDAKGGWALLNTSTARLSPWLTRSAQVDSMWWVSLWCWAAGLLYWPFHLLTACVSFFFCFFFSLACLPLARHQH